MTTYLHTAPVAAGKTTHALDLARRHATSPEAQVRVCVASHLQASEWQRRLAQGRGVLGGHVYTFPNLVEACLDEAKPDSYTRLSDPVQFRLLRHLARTEPLTHYAPLANKPGFTQILRDRILLLKNRLIAPAEFTSAVADLGNPARLHELAQIYSAYQDILQRRNWADAPGRQWLAVVNLTQDPNACRWPLLIVDGFNNFDRAQVLLLRHLADRVDELHLYLTDPGGVHAYPRFQRTLDRVEDELSVRAQPLPPAGTSDRCDVLRHLSSGLFESRAERMQQNGRILRIAAPDQAAEVRAALRWLKKRIVHDDCRSDQVALLARTIEPYRPYIWQTAREFGLPLRLDDGLPLANSPVISALLDLLRLSLPVGSSPQPSLPRRLVLEAWRSPYFDWSRLGISATDADQLDIAARNGRVISGLSQWQEALSALTQRTDHPDRDDDEDLPAPQLLSTDQAGDLQARFNRFLRQIQPSANHLGLAGWVRWLEALLGPDTEKRSDGGEEVEPEDSLRVVARVREAGDTVAHDIAALRSLKELLRGLVMADSALGDDGGGALLTFTEFVSELGGAIDAATYEPPDSGGILVASAANARGLSFRAVAIVGLAEGVFPATISEDPFLRDADRAAMQATHEFVLEPSTQSDEEAFFYEAVARATDYLLLTRPRLSDSGAEWVASPFWDAVGALVDAEEQLLTSEQGIAPDAAVSWPELLETAVSNATHPALQTWIQQQAPARWTAVQAGSALLRLRQAAAPTPYDGVLHAAAGTLAQTYGPDHVWSASRLETYRACGYRFFVERALRLEPRPEPTAGLDARQLGSIYHDILERIYADPRAQAPLDDEQARALAAEIARPVLDAAPQEQGFRVTAWWAQTRQEIVENVARTLLALANLDDTYTPWDTEVSFVGSIDLPDGNGRFHLHGFIDRIDRSPDGQVRIIDYKLGGPSSYSLSNFRSGQRLQLPLYALAARDALQLGTIADGFYWHITQAEPSPFTLAKADGGMEGALETAVSFTWQAIQGVRDGVFTPTPPTGGCPGYCPAAAFCWHYTPGWGG